MGQSARWKIFGVGGAGYAHSAASGNQEHKAWGWPAERRGRGGSSGGTRADAFTRDLLSGSDAATVVRTRKMNKNDPR